MHRPNPYSRTGRLGSVVDWTRRVMTEPGTELTRWQRAVRFAVDLGILGGRQLRHDRASQMAGALAFRTLFGLVPTILVATLLVRALGGFTDFQASLEDRLLSLLSSEAAPAPAATPAPDGDSPMAEAEAGAEAAEEMLARFIATVVEAVEQINLAAITWVGVAVLAYAAISLMSTIESAFNVICRAPEGRSWFRRVPIYWTVLTLAPLVIALVAIVDHQVDGFLERTIGPGWPLRTAAVAWSLSITTLLMLAIYKLVPNTSVPTPHALAGAITATIGIEILKRSFGVYVEHAAGLRQLTGSVGLVPLFMFWVYLLWLVVLFGLEVCQVLVRSGGRELEAIRTERAPSIVDPSAVLLVAGVVAARFADGRPSTAAAVSGRTGLPSRAVEPMLERLTEAGVLHRIAGEEGAFTFARPPEEVPAADLLGIGQELFAVGGGGAAGAANEAGGLLERIRQAQQAAAGDLTAAALGRGMSPG